MTEEMFRDFLSVTVLSLLPNDVFWMMSTRVTEPMGGDNDSTGELTAEYLSVKQT